MRREYEWVDYLKSIDDDRKQRALTGKGAIVSAREGGVMVQTPERQTTTIKKDVADKIPDAMPLACAEAILEYSPIDVCIKFRRAARYSSLSKATPSRRNSNPLIYTKKRASLRNWLLYKKTTHYGIYNDYFDDVAANVVDWYNRHLKYHKVEVTEKK